MATHTKQGAFDHQVLPDMLRQILDRVDRTQATGYGLVDDDTEIDELEDFDPVAQVADDMAQLARIDNWNDVTPTV